MKKGKFVKKGNSKVAKTLRERKDPRIEEIYEKEIEFMCPKRGLVKQKVKIKRYKTLAQQPSSNVISGADAISKIQEKDDGMAMFNADDLDLEKEE